MAARAGLGHVRRSLDPDVNIKLGTRIFIEHYKIFSGNGFLLRPLITPGSQSREATGCSEAGEPRCPFDVMGRDYSLRRDPATTSKAC